ncbi:hypothetical protein ACIQYF_15015 [Pseudomonas sp. NPDC096917]
MSYHIVAGVLILAIMGGAIVGLLRVVMSLVGQVYPLFGYGGVLRLAPW